MIVAQIAMNYLSQEQSDSVKGALSNALQNINTFDDADDTFVTAAVWMDDLKSRGSYLFADWHFINIPICDPAYENICDTTSIPEMVDNDDNVVFAINECISTFKSRYAGGFERGLALYVLLHLIGDIHQPLHCVNKFTAASPNGDEGGNTIKFSFPGGISNLHQLWDSGVTLLNNSIDRPLTDDAQAYIVNMAQTIQSQTDLSAITPGTNITEWAMEGVPLAINYVYNFTTGSVPDQAYVDAALPIVIQQLGKAGYRLAQVLQLILPCNSGTNNCPQATQAPTPAPTPASTDAPTEAPTSAPTPPPSDISSSATSISITVLLSLVLVVVSFII